MRRLTCHTWNGNSKCLTTSRRSQQSLASQLHQLSICGQEEDFFFTFRDGRRGSSCDWDNRPILYQPVVPPTLCRNPAWSTEKTRTVNCAISKYQNRFGSTRMPTHRHQLWIWPAHAANRLVLTRCTPLYNNACLLNKLMIDRIITDHVLTIESWILNVFTYD
jgi:hypothetical protein